MNLREITMIPQASDSFFQVTKDTVSNKMFMGKSDHREIYSTFIIHENEPHFIFFNEDEKGVSSYLIVREDNVFGRDAAIIARSWTRPDVRNKGYLSAIVKFIRDFLKMQVVSDNLQTPSSKMFWDSLKKKFEVKTLDVNSSAIIDADAYSLPSYRLIIESRSSIMREGLKPNTKKNNNKWVDPVLVPLIVFTDGDI
jgi:hypothetical protein